LTVYNVIMYPAKIYRLLEMTIVQLGTLLETSATIMAPLRQHETSGDHHLLGTIETSLHHLAVHGTMMTTDVDPLLREIDMDLPLPLTTVAAMLPHRSLLIVLNRLRLLHRTMIATIEDLVRGILHICPQQDALGHLQEFVRNMNAINMRPESIMLSIADDRHPLPKADTLTMAGHLWRLPPG